MKELGDKVTPEQKAEAEKAMDELKAAMEKDDLEEIKAKMRSLDEVMHRISERLYQQAQAQGTQTGSPGPDQKGQEDVVDADYTEEK